MKKVLMVGLALLVSVAFVTAVFAQAPAKPAEKPAAAPEKAPAPAPKAPAPEKKAPGDCPCAVAPGGRGGDAGVPAPDRGGAGEQPGASGRRIPHCGRRFPDHPGAGASRSHDQYRLSERGADELYLRQFAGCPEDD